MIAIPVIGYVNCKVNLKNRGVERHNASKELIAVCGSAR